MLLPRPAVDVEAVLDAPEINPPRFEKMAERSTFPGTATEPEDDAPEVGTVLSAFDAALTRRIVLRISATLGTASIPGTDAELLALVSACVGVICTNHNTIAESTITARRKRCPCTFIFILVELIVE
jgi:hypothetical protein